MNELKKIESQKPDIQVRSYQSQLLTVDTYEPLPEQPASAPAAPIPSNLDR